MSYQEKDVIKEAKTKAARYCSYRERAPFEVIQKLRDYGLTEEENKQILEELTTAGFLDEHRFALSLANGKLRQNKWGKVKIRIKLEQYKIDSNYIDSALEAIPKDYYQNTLQKLVDNKLQSLRITDPLLRKHKVAQFVLSKGFEPELIWNLLRDMDKLEFQIPDNKS